MTKIYVVVTAVHRMFRPQILKAMTFFCINHMETKWFFKFEIIINVLVTLSASFEYTYVIGLQPV